jgi:peroxiredoxin
MPPKTVLAFLVSLLVSTVAVGAGDPPKPEVGRPAPDFTVTTLGGAKVRLQELRGKVVFVNLWATWCPPCREEVPSMVRLYQQMKGRGVEIVAVSEDRDRAALEKFVKQHGATFPVTQDEDKRIYGLYRATGVPETHLIDKQGNIRQIWIGSFDWTAPQIVKTVESLLKR